MINKVEVEILEEIFDVKINDNATSVKKEETGIKEITKKIEVATITVDASDNINVLIYLCIINISNKFKNC